MHRSMLSGKRRTQSDDGVYAGNLFANPPRQRPVLRAPVACAGPRRKSLASPETEASTKICAVPCTRQLDFVDSPPQLPPAPMGLWLQLVSEPQASFLAEISWNDSRMNFFRKQHKPGQQLAARAGESHATKPETSECPKDDVATLVFQRDARPIFREWVAPGRNRLPAAASRTIGIPPNPAARRAASDRAGC